MTLELVSTIQKKGKTEMTHQTVPFFRDEAGIENQVINIYPEISYETFEGFGGAITDSAAFVYSQMEEWQKKEVINTYFSQENMKYCLVRVHMDSCDFSVEQYEAMSDPSDVDLKSFSFERTEKYILPMLEDAKAAAGGNIKLMLSPWSPPAFMKTNGSRVKGGSIRPEYRKMWAEYICRYIKEFQNRGFEVERISLQNEPKAVQTWDSCIYSAEEEKEFLKEFMYPALQEQGLSDIEIFIWDHNKERIYERVRDIVDDTTDNMVAGAAFHWYSGDHFEALELVRQKYPDKKLIMSESCLEYSVYGTEDVQNQAIRLSREIIGDLNHGMCAFYDWNLLLDEQGGPNHVGNYCHAPFLYDTKNKKLMPQSTKAHFYHFSHHITPGSKRIATTKYTDKLEVVAYKTLEKTIVLVILNKSKETVPAIIRLENKMAEIQMQPGGIATCIVK